MKKEGIIKIGPEFVKDFISRAKSNNSYSFKGRVTAVRKHTKRTFLDLSDHTGTIQIVAECNSLENYKRISSISPGSYIEVKGKYFKSNQPEIKADSIKIITAATLPISPNPWKIDGLSNKYANQVFNLTEFYLANPQRMAVLKIKSNFIRALDEYFSKNGFTLVEPPILTNKTLYGPEKAVHAEVHGEKVFLTQCATFELEPLAMVYGKVYTISPAFRNEKGGSKRHLGEYTHLKAEALFVDLNDLMLLAGDSIYYAIRKTVERSKRELELLKVKINLNALNPKNYVDITYDDAIKILNSNGSKIKYGEGLSREDEIILTKHFENRYLWIKFLPFKTEGFPYKRKSDAPHLSMTCDLIAPHGAGEMVGVAEKTTDIDELIENMIKKERREDIRQYWNYILLRKYGLPPHGGIGAAPERIIYGILGLNHIKYTKPFPRYPEKRINAIPGERLNPWKDKDLDRIINKFSIE